MENQPAPRGIHPDFPWPLEGLPNQLTAEEAAALGGTSTLEGWQRQPEHFARYSNMVLECAERVLKPPMSAPAFRVAALDAVLPNLLVGAGGPKLMGRSAQFRQLARDPTSMRIGRATAAILPAGATVGLQHLRKSMAHNTSTVLSPEGHTTRSMTSKVWHGVMPLPVNGEPGEWPRASRAAPHPSAQYKAGSISLVSHAKYPELVSYELVMPDDLNGDLVTYHTYHKYESYDSTSPGEGHRLGVHSSWPGLPGLGIAPGMGYCYVEEAFCLLHPPAIHYHWVPEGQRLTMLDAQGRARKVMGHLLFLEVQFWVGEDLKGSRVLEDVYIFESLGPDNGLGWSAESPVGVLGAPFTQAGFVLPDQLWADEWGDLRKGVFSMQMVGAPGLVVDVGLVDVSEVKLAPTAFRCTRQGEEHFYRAFAELVAHTGIHLLVGADTVMGAFDSYCIAVGHNGGTAADYVVHPIHNHYGMHCSSDEPSVTIRLGWGVGVHQPVNSTLQRVHKLNRLCEDDRVAEGLVARRELRARQRELAESLALDDLPIEIGPGGLQSRVPALQREIGRAQLYRRADGKVGERDVVRVQGSVVCFFLDPHQLFVSRQPAVSYARWSQCTAAQLQLVLDQRLEAWEVSQLIARCPDVMDAPVLRTKPRVAYPEVQDHKPRDSQGNLTSGNEPPNPPPEGSLWDEPQYPRDPDHAWDHDFSRGPLKRQLTSKGEAELLLWKRQIADMSDSFSHFGTPEEQRQVGEGPKGLWSAGLVVDDAELYARTASEHLEAEEGPEVLKMYHTLLPVMELLVEAVTLIDRLSFPQAAPPPQRTHAEVTALQANALSYMQLIVEGLGKLGRGAACVCLAAAAESPAILFEMEMHATMYPANGLAEQRQLLLSVLPPAALPTVMARLLGFMSAVASVVQLPYQLCYALRELEGKLVRWAQVSMRDGTDLMRQAMTNVHYAFHHAMRFIQRLVEAGGTASVPQWDPVWMARMQRPHDALKPPSLGLLLTNVQLMRCCLAEEVENANLATSAITAAGSRLPQWQHLAAKLAHERLQVAWEAHEQAARSYQQLRTAQLEAVKGRRLHANPYHARPHAVRSNSDLPVYHSQLNNLVADHGTRYELTTYKKVVRPPAAVPVVEPVHLRIAERLVRAALREERRCYPHRAWPWQQRLWGEANEAWVQAVQQQRRIKAAHREAERQKIAAADRQCPMQVDT